MRTLRIIGEIAAILGVLWLSVASSDDEGDDSGSSSTEEPGNNGQPGGVLEACEVDTDCTAFNGADLCFPQVRCVGSLCVPTEPVACTKGQGTCKPQVCDPPTGSCKDAPLPDGSSCDDGNACTSGDQCKSGGCVAGNSQACDDGNPCTNDTCNPAQGCTYQPKGAGSACPYPDQCYQAATCSPEGQCVPGPAKVCDDGNDCTADWCDSQTGCRNDPMGDAPCDDGDACTFNDTCGTGACAGVAANDGDLCEDGNPCTGGTTCTGGACGGGGPIGDGGACDDGDPCTEATACAGGECTGGTPVTCQDDGNPCSVEACDPAVGCTASPAPQGTECPSQNPCWEKALCEGMECSMGVPKLNGTECDDGQPCTGGSVCQSGSCVAGTPLGDGAACDDSNPCTTGETCSGGWCGNGVGVVCDDGNACTSDWCDAVSGCVYDPVGDGTGCQVGGGCIIEATCQGGVCVGSDACDDGDACTLDECGAGEACSNTWQASVCPAEVACANGKDDDADGAADCAQPGCPQLAGAACDTAVSLPASASFDTEPGPGFGAWAHAAGAGAHAFAVDGTPASVKPWSGAKTLNFNDGTEAGFPADATEGRARARLCCFDGQQLGGNVYVSWMEYVDIPSPEEGAEPVRGLRITRNDGQPDVDVPLTLQPVDRGKWRRRVVPVAAPVPFATFGVEWWIGDAPAPWSGGAGWFIDDVEIARDEDCINGSDDNGNGKIDCADPVCDQYDGCQELLCADGLDDNGDGLVDCDDQDCALAPECQ